MRSNSRVIIETIDDTLAENDGQVILTLIEGHSYQVGGQAEAIVIISDKADRIRRSNAISAAGQDVLSDLVGSIGSRSISTTTNRVRSAFSANGPTTHFELNDTDQITELLKAGGEMINAETISMRSILGSSSFTMDLFPEQGSSSIATIWGLGDYRDLRSRGLENANSWDGDIFTGQVGFDAKLGTSFLAGLSTSIIESEVKHEGVVEDGIMFRTSFTALNPYFGWTSVDQRTQLRSIAGYGLGDIALEQNNYNPELLSSYFYSFGFSGEHQLYATETLLGSGLTELNITSESWSVSQFVSGIADKINDMESKGSYHRITAIGSHQFDLDSGSSLKPIASIGLRRDQKNQDSIVGIELGSGLNYSNPIGYSFSGSSDILMVNYDEIRKWNLKGNLTYDYAGDKLGTLFEVSPSIGRILDSSSNALWSSEILDEVNELGQYSDGAGVNSEFGYGFEILDRAGILTPMVGFDMTNGEVEEYYLTTRVLLDSGINFVVKSTQKVSAEGGTKQEVRLSGGMSW